MGGMSPASAAAHPGLKRRAARRGGIVRVVSAFYVCGLALAGWAVILAAIGLKRPDFPGSGGKRVVIAISLVLATLAIGSGIVVGVLESGAEEAEAEAVAALTA
jgi:hypothetical protein